MKLLRTLTMMILLATATIASGADMGTSGGFDLDALWTAAQQTYDLDTEDAVVLLESQDVTLSATGDVATTVHRVVWIGSSVGIHQYADLRVPWNPANSELEVLALRTWRDDQWWPGPTQISETAVVVTLPYAVDHADDYTTLRETMLLHDGIELPCIMETRYTITRHGMPAADGTFVFPQRDPAVRVRLTVTTPAAAPWHQASLNGAPAPIETTDGSLRRAVWDLSPVSALGLPTTAEPDAYEPAVVYSTWESWATLGKAFTEAFDTAAYIDGALADTVAIRTAHITDPLEQVQNLLDLVQESTRRIGYDFRFWDQPRPAVRTWETAYGHDLDRVALAAGTLRSLAVIPLGSGAPDLTANPVFLGRGTVAVAPNVPRLSGAGDLALEITIPDDTRLLWTPDGVLHGSAWAQGRPLTAPATQQPVFIPKTDADNLLAVDLTLVPSEDEGWSWSGTLSAQGIFSFQNAVFTGKALAKAATSTLGDLLPEIDIDTCNPRKFAPLFVTVACSGELAEPDENDAGDLVLTVGDPGDGVLKRLPGDIHLYQSTRTAKALITPMVQNIRVQMPLDGFEVLTLPAITNVANDAGRFMASGVVKDGNLFYKRSLMLSGQGTWPELRALLLEASDNVHRDIVRHPGGEK